jgi:hypothetical protein
MVAATSPAILSASSSALKTADQKQQDGLRRRLALELHQT